MSKTTTITALNGSPASSDDQRGVAVLRDREAKSLISISCDAMSEARELGHRMHTVIYKGDVKASMADLRRQLAEALICQATTEHYLRMLASVLDELFYDTADPYGGTSEPPAF